MCRHQASSGSREGVSRRGDTWPDAVHLQEGFDDHLVGFCAVTREEVGQLGQSRQVETNKGVKAPEGIWRHHCQSGRQLCRRA